MSYKIIDSNKIFKYLDNNILMHICMSKNKYIKLFLEENKELLNIDELMINNRKWTYDFIKENKSIIENAFMKSSEFRNIYISKDKADLLIKLFNGNKIERKKSSYSNKNELIKNIYIYNNLTPDKDGNIEIINFLTNTIYYIEANSLNFILERKEDINIFNKYIE